MDYPTGWNKARKQLLDIFLAGVNAVDPSLLVHRHLQRESHLLRAAGVEYDLDNYERIVVVGFGKAVCPMAQAIEDILKDRLISGIVSVKYEFDKKLERIRVVEAGHPVPDRNGVAAAEKIVLSLKDLSSKDLVICLISGGGSALLPFPWDGITLDEKQNLTRELLHSGASIREINTIRKHISRVKGGYLAQAAYPATLITLIVSDVPGDPLDMIASGPTVPDPTTFQDCMDILDRYGFLNDNRVAPSILYHFKNMITANLDTPKPGDRIFEKTRNLLVGSNEDALQACVRKTTELGYHAFRLSRTLEGDSRTVGNILASIAKEIQSTGLPAGMPGQSAKLPVCILAGGETTVTVKGHGKGGRNTELALGAAFGLRNTRGITLISAGTDGNDGDTDAAGAVADGQTINRARQQNLDPLIELASNNSYIFFDALNDLVKTGPTFTNVMDLQIILVESV